MDGIARLPIESPRAGADPFEQRLQPVGDRLDGGQIHGAGRSLQAVGAAEHVVPVRGRTAQGRPDRRDVLPVLDVEGGEQQLADVLVADVLGHARAALSAGIVRRAP